MARFGTVTKDFAQHCDDFVATSLTFFLASSFMNPRSNFEQRTPRPPHRESIEENLYRTNLNDKTPVIEGVIRSGL